MGDSDSPNFLDKVVEALARVLDALGLNGARLRWRWNQRRRELGERKVRASVFLRSGRGTHKMCPSCRALVPRSARECTECGAAMADVRAPGVGRLVSNLFPGITATTSLLLLVNGFWFVMMLMAQLRSGSGAMGLLSFFDPELLVRFGSGLSFEASLADGTVTGGEWWRIVTPIFLHAGLLHFFFNSYVLIQLGPLVEELYGTERYWIIYLACGIAGSATSQFLRPVNTIGASGAILGLMGLLLVYGWRRGGPVGENLKASMIRFGLYILVFSLLVRGVDHFNHAGGFACGALLGFVVPSGPFRDRSAAVAWEAASFAGILLVLACFYHVARLAG